MAASMYLEFAYFTISFRVCNFKAILLPGMQVHSLFIMVGKTFPNLRSTFSNKIDLYYFRYDLSSFFENEPNYSFLLSVT